MSLKVLKLVGLIAVVLLLFSMGSCSNIEKRTSNPTGLSGEALFEKLLLFQEEVGVPSSEYYGGISFNGYGAFLGNLTIFIVGEQNIQETRDALLKVFGQEGKDVSIEAWNNESTVADEALKREFTEILPSDSVISIGYDESKDRLVVGLESVDVVTEYEDLILAQLDVPRETFIFQMRLPVQLGSR